MKQQETNPRRYFTHYRNGKRYDAWEYGYKAWPIGASGANAGDGNRKHTK